tara:strand:- start:31372 stop:32043 length:672 start_codon:yes stop_codon:yes gene_type:complete
MATLGQRITDLIGSDYEVIPSVTYNDLIRAAVNETVDNLPNDLLLKYCYYKTNITAAGLDSVEEKKVLMVAREIDDSTLEIRECIAVPYNEFLKVQDTNSLYCATIESPVYTYDVSTANDPKLKIFPVPTDAQLGYVWHFNYIGTGNDTAAESSIGGLPDICLQAIVYRACVNILQSYISDFVQDEEDSEMLAMLSTQMQSLQGAYTLEMQRFTETDKQPRGE